MEDKRYSKDELLYALRWELFEQGHLHGILDEEKGHYYTVVGLIIAAIERYDALPEHLKYVKL